MAWYQSYNGDYFQNLDRSTKAKVDAPSTLSLIQISLARSFRVKMADRFRAFVTSAVQVAVQLMIWIGRSNTRITYLDKIYKTEKGVKHL